MLKRIARKKHDYSEIYAYKRKYMTVSLYIYKEIYNIFYSFRNIAGKPTIINFVKHLIRR